MKENGPRIRQLLLYMLILLLGGTLYAWSVFCEPLAANLSALTGRPVTSSSLSLAFSLSFVGSPAGMMLAGALHRRAGLRAGIAAGSAMFIIGMAGTAFSPRPWLLILFYGIFFGIGSGMIFCSALSGAVALFPGHRGVAGGLASMSWGLSSMLYAPLDSALVQAVGITTTMAGIAVCSGGLIWLLTFLLRADLCGGPAARTESIASGREVVWKDMIRTPEFRLMWIFMMLSCTASLMLFSSCVPIATRQLGISEMQASFVVALLALASTCGRFCGGLLSDFLGRINTLLLAVVILVFGLTAMLFSSQGQVALFALGCIGLGVTYGSVNAIYPSFVADVFGARELSRNYGFMNLACCAASFAGPALLYLTSREGGYALTYASAIAVSALGLCTGWLLKRQLRPQRNP